MNIIKTGATCYLVYTGAYGRTRHVTKDKEKNRQMQMPMQIPMRMPMQIPMQMPMQMQMPQIYTFLCCLTGDERRGDEVRCEETR